MRVLRQAVSSLFELVYPRVCCACGQEHPSNEGLLCLRCEAELPRTQHWLSKENPLTERFWGRVPIEGGAALYNFRKGSRVQHRLHQLKYEGKQQIGEHLGILLGRELAKGSDYQDIELIVPVPLHPRKRRRRGYNQSDSIARGLASALQTNWSPTALQRTIFTESQTKKDRTERLKNVLEVFAVNPNEQLENKHLLLVDDVMTTGATLEACARKLLEVPNTRVSIATLALALN